MVRKNIIDSKYDTYVGQSVVGHTQAQFHPGLNLLEGNSEVRVGMWACLARPHLRVSGNMPTSIYRGLETCMCSLKLKCPEGPPADF